ncbi:MAG: fasciclin domain-containing protein [Cyclobacteriaceae bacterium]|nr:fasciclin domain-containing protein [Cyclobacteriaceae bacterium]
MKKIITFAAALITGLFFVSSCSDNFKEAAVPTGSTIVKLADANPDLDILTAALTKTGLATSLANVNSGSFTVFAPTDAAFVAYFNTLTIAQLPPGSAAPGTFDEAAVLAAVNLLANSYTPASASSITINSVSGILSYHLISSKIKSSAITGSQGFATINGARLSLSKVADKVVLNANRTGQNVAANGGQSVALDVEASNGVIHTIDKVLIPVSNANIWLASLLNFSVNYGIAPPAITVYGTVLKRYVVEAPAIATINLEDATALAPVDASGTNYNLLSMAIARAELATLFITTSTPFPEYTVFAPTDAAFVTFLGVADEAAARTALNAKTPTELANILKYHVIPGRVLSTDLTNNQVVPTALTGKSFTIKINGAVVAITDAKGNTTSTITSIDNLTNAGVVHRIDKVLESN